MDKGVRCGGEARYMRLGTGAPYCAQCLYPDFSPAMADLTAGMMASRNARAIAAAFPNPGHGFIEDCKPPEAENAA